VRSVQISSGIACESTDGPVPKPLPKAQAIEAGASQAASWTGEVKKMGSSGIKVDRDKGGVREVSARWERRAPMLGQEHA
jgi:hypothetical protein